MSYNQNKQIGLALLFVINEFEASKNCQASLVVQYILNTKIFTCYNSLHASG